MLPALKRLATAALTILAALPAAVWTQVPATATPPAAAFPAPRLDSLLDLETVIQRALSVSPAVAGAREGVRTAQSEKRVAFGEYTPNVFAISQALSSNSTSAGAASTTPPNAVAPLASRRRLT